MGKKVALKDLRLGRMTLYELRFYKGTLDDENAPCERMCVYCESRAKVEELCHIYAVEKNLYYDVYEVIM